MRVQARRVDGFAHEVELDGDHELVIDEPADRGGTDTGPRPTELLAASLAGCTAITMEMYAGRKGWDVDGLAVAVEMETPEDERPRTFTVSLTLPAALEDEQRRRLTVIAGKCPVHKLLSQGAEVTISDRVELV